MYYPQNGNRKTRRISEYIPLFNYISYCLGQRTTDGGVKNMSNVLLITKNGYYLISTRRLGEIQSTVVPTLKVEDRRKPK